MAGGFLQAADDMVRIISNGMTFGAADKVASALGEQDTAAKTAAARERAGFAGDLGSMLGVGGGAKLAFKGLKMAPTIAKAAFSKKGAAAAALGLGGLVEYNTRTANAQAPTAKTPKAAAATKQPDVNALATKIAGAARGSANEAPPSMFDDMIMRLAAGQDGEVSLRQLGALSEAAQRGAAANTAGVSKKAVAPGDAAGRMLEQMYVTQFEKALNDPRADPAKAQEDFESKVLQLRKTQFIDPYGLQGLGDE